MSQTVNILNHMQKGMHITPLQALKLYGCLRLSARILNLREAGYPVKVERFEVKGPKGKRASVARYSL